MAQNGPKWPKMAQNCILIYAHVPFWDFLILNLNISPFLGHAILCAFFIPCNHDKMRDTQYAHKKMKIIRLPNLVKRYHFVIILLSSRGMMCDLHKYTTSFGM